jgi:CSLREA domain-containing protein
MISRHRRAPANTLGVLGVLLLTLVYCFPAAIRAATFNVDSAGDTTDANPGDGVCATAGTVCTLRAAVQEANAWPGADVINVPGLTITLGSALNVTESLTIAGAGQGLTLLSGNNVTRVLSFDPLSGTHSLSSLTIQNANTGLNGGGVFNGGNLTVTSVTFLNNHARQGGGVYCDTAGGAYQPTLTLTAVAFTGNSSTTAVFGEGGGALFNGCTLNGTDLMFNGNTSQQGGAFYNNSFETVTFSDFVMSGNTAKWGGAINNDLGVINLLRGTISGNTSECCDPSNGDPTGGGGISHNEGSMSLTDVALRDNSATSPGGYGGAIYSSESMTLTRVSLSGNRAAYGAGIYNGNFVGQTNSMDLTNVTVSGNVGTGSVSPLVDPVGGGIYNTTQGHLVITNSTIAGNSAVVAGGIESTGTNSSVTLRNTIVADNSTTFGSIDCRGPIASAGHNILESSAGCSFTPATGDQLGVDPQLLGRIGNPAYHPLRVDSPAFQTGDNTFCPETDQRGLFRPENGFCDVGAYEIGDRPGVGDLDGDLHADLVWRNVAPGPVNGALYVWLLNGTSLAGASYLDPISTRWQIQGLGDFNGDGKVDVLWRERYTAATYVWLMNGSSVIGAGYTAAQADAHWQVQGLGDFNGDGKTDLVWRNVGPAPDVGALFLWLMDGTDLASSGYLPPISLDWQIQQVGDFDGGGMADVLWRERNTGSTYLWLMNGTTVAGQGYTTAQTDTAWQVQGVGDFNQDGRADMLWRKIGPGGDQGALYIWLMDGTSVINAAFLPPISLDWDVQAVADFNGDQRSDILWREVTSGSTYLWFMNGVTVSGQGYTTSQADDTWQLRHPR